MKSPSRTAALFLCGLLAAGCSTLYKRADQRLDTEGVAFEAGETHFHEVLDQLGPPTRMSAVGEGFAFIYEEYLIRENQFGIGGREGLLQLIKLSFADSVLFRRVAILRFDAGGILVALSKANTREGLGKSGAIQPILAVKQLVDTSSYEDDSIESLDWGTTLLEPMPHVLNLPQSLNSGQAGLEQGGTTYKVGQHTLEMR
jgi:hypothetical protein